MSLDYTTATVGLFVRLGKIIKEVNRLATEVTTTLDAAKTEILAGFEAADLDEQVDAVPQQFQGYIDQRIAQRQEVAAIADQVFNEYTTSLSQLGLLDFTPDNYFPALYRQMVADSKTVDRSTVSIGSVTANAANIGNGTVLITKRLDGFNAPVADGIVVPWYATNAVNSELAINETMLFTVVADQDTGAQEGSEQLTWQGALNDPNGDFGQREGSGNGPTLNAIGSASLIANSDMESWETEENLPDGWEDVAGTVGTHILETTSVVYRGDSALQFKGDGAQATIHIKQDIAAGTLNPLRMYCMTARVKCSTAAPAAGDLEIALTGTGWTVPSTDKITIAHGALTTSWQLGSAFILTPLVLPTDLNAYIKVTGTLTNTVTISIDDVILTEVPYHGGLGAVVVPGSTPFAFGDRFTSAITNDQAGLIQEFFRIQYGVQLPSDGSGSENILDSLAA